MKNNMFRHLTMLLFALLPFTGWAQQKNYDGQHVSIKRTTGDSIQYDLGLSRNFKPIVQEGKVSWQFQGDANFSLENIESFDFRSFEYDEAETRKALMEFYHAMDGDNWAHHENWGSDKPISEWYGINIDGIKVPWVRYMELTFNNLSGKLPENIQCLGPIRYLQLYGNNIEGELPGNLGNDYSLHSMHLFNNKLTGIIPETIGELPYLETFSVEQNSFEGTLPEKFILSCMDNTNLVSNNLVLLNNDFSGKVPKSIQQHPRFANFWPSIVIQNNPMDVSDLVIPAPNYITKDINGNTIDLAELYKSNKYTLIYVWNLSNPESLVYNQKLIPAYNYYKDKGLEVIGFHMDLQYDDGLSDYLKSNDIPWRNAIRKDWGWQPDGSPSDVGLLYYAFYPKVFLVDSKGDVVFNSLMDSNGNNQMFTSYHDELFTYLEEQLGPFDYKYYTSTDYSHDGDVVTLQKATKGKGFDLVFVGEGFTDKDLEDGGAFDERMKESLEKFFAYEPYTSLRDRFNVYAVKAVSPNAEFADACTHAIDVDPSKALEYASKVTDLIPDRPMRVTVVYNKASGGRSYCMMMEDDSYVCFAMDGDVTDVLNHESGGHGIGKLLDEYVESGNESLSLPEENKAELENVWTTKGWGANVDWRSDPTEVKWAKFINDERYADERIGVYEGSYLYQYGAYRPTENSMMRYNNIGFNAPSREEIYKRVMKESEGDSWTYDYETFVAFDAAGHTQFVNNLNGASMARGEKAPEVQPILRTAPPVFMKGTWRDALKKDKK